MNKSIRRLTHPRALFNVVSRTVGTGARFVGVLMLMGAFALSPLAPLAGLSTQAVHAAGGDGSQGNPFIIENATEFVNLIQNVDNADAHFRLANDITLPSNYTTIGTFTGYLDGNGNEISGLNKALFGEIETLEIDLGDGEWETVGGVVEDLIVSGDITLVVDTNNYGLLAGSIKGASVKNVSAHGSIEVTADSCSVVGGLVGEAFYSNIENATADVEIDAVNCNKVGGLIGSSVNTPVTKTGSFGSVTGHNAVGGLVGHGVCGDNGAGIRESFATGDVSGNDYVGGLVGNAEGSECSGIVLENVYARGATSGNAQVGGLVGSFYGDVLEKGYSTGSVTGDVVITTGGLVGEKSEWSSGINNSFWSAVLSGVTISAGGAEAGDIGESLTDEYTYTGWFENGGEWNFANTWSIEENENDGYPCLQWSDESCAFTYGGGSDALIVTSFSPADNATNVSTNANLVITFNQNAVSTESGSIIIFDITDDEVFEQIEVNSGAVSGSGTTWTINPTNDFDAGHTYAVWVGTATFNAADESSSLVGWDDNTTWNFTTASGGGNNNEELSFTNPTDKTVAPYDSLPITDLAIEGDANEVLNVNLYTNFGTLEFGNVTGLTFVGSHMGPNLQFSGTRTAINAALETLTFSASSEGEATVEAIINGDDGEVMWFTNGHVYKVVTVPGGITWDDARTAAAGQTFGGVGGYLATIIDEEESDFVLTRIDESGWIGATDVAVEGEWNWVTGPEAVTKFWTGGMNGSAFDGKFNNWRREGANLEPNNAGGEVDGNPGEDCAQIRFGVGIPPGSWNDSPCNSTFNTYVVEFGGIDGELPDVVRTHFDITVSEAGDWADLTTVSATNIGKTSATIQGSGQLKNGLTVDDIDVGDGGILQVGFHFNTDSTVNWDENTHTAPVMNASAVGGNNTQVTFSGEVTGLECGTQYWYVAAYDYDAGGELGVASNVLSFTTASCGGGSGSSSGGGSRGGTRSPAVTSPTTPTAVPTAVANVITQNRDLFIAARDAGITLPPFILNLLGLGGEAPAGGLCPRYAFTRDLRFGDEGEDVRALQRFFNCAGFALGTSGPGAPGEETQYFVERTRTSLIKFQEQYAVDVLAPINHTQGTGIFSSYSRAKVHSLMAQ